MAINFVNYCLLRDLLERGLLPQGGAILELGEANVYGQELDDVLPADIRKYVTDPARRDALSSRLAAIDPAGRYALFEKAKLAYELLFAPSEVQSIDLHGTPAALMLDLNEPVRLSTKFDVTYNHGTAEHVFNVAQVFRTIHEWTVPGGLMIHGAPFHGWIDHGFYNLQPTLFFDLAEFNGYEILGMYVTDLGKRSVLGLAGRNDVFAFARQGRIPENATLFVVLRQGTPLRPFRYPLQGYYRDALPEGGAQAWREMR